MSTPASFSIALAEPADLPRLREIYDWAVEHTAATFATRPEANEAWIEAWDATHRAYPWLVARSNGGVVGYARASPHRPRGAYAWTAELAVYVDPGQHGRGLGRALYQALIPLLRAQGYVTLLAVITGGHEHSERLHQSAGFARCGTCHRAGWKFSRWHDVGYWELHLQPDGAPPTAIRPVREVWLSPERDEP